MDLKALTKAISTLLLAACSTTSFSENRQGDEGGPCFPNHTCNGALACLSNICVNPDSGRPGKGGSNEPGSGGRGTAGAGGNAAGAGPTGGTGGAGGNAGGAGGGRGGVGGQPTGGTSGNAASGGVTGGTSSGGTDSGSCLAQGETCLSDGECCGNMRCLIGKCLLPDGDSCTEDLMCSSFTCENGKCQDCHRAEWGCNGAIQVFGYACCPGVLCYEDRCCLDDNAACMTGGECCSRTCTNNQCAQGQYCLQPGYPCDPNATYKNCCHPWVCTNTGQRYECQ